MEIRRINYQYLDMLRMLEERDRIVGARYYKDKSSDAIIFEFKVKSKGSINKYVFQTDNYHTLTDCLDLYRQFKINQRNKKLRIKKFATRATAFTAACVMSISIPIAINMMVYRSETDSI